MNMNKKIIFLVLAGTLFSNILFAQHKGKTGLSGSIQGSDFGILIPVWVGEKTVIAPAFELKFGEKIGTDFAVGLATRMYLKTEKLCPYYGFKLGALVNIPSSANEIDTETKIDLVGGLAFGAEYFFVDNFSVGVELQGNITKSGTNSARFGNPGGINFNTGTMVIATIYF